MAQTTDPAVDTGSCTIRRSKERYALVFAIAVPGRNVDATPATAWTLPHDNPQQSTGCRTTAPTHWCHLVT